MILFLPIIAALSVLGKAKALPQYAQKIPNGYNVPNPGPQGGVWAGVGHESAAGGGDRNLFGMDFAANEHEWTLALCQTDSDGDGRSNGEELGDPDCIWAEGKKPTGPALSHPGVVDEPKVPSASNCDVYEAPEDEMTMDIAFSTPTQMDETQTHYICEQKVIDVPAQTTLHLIKTRVLLDNPDVLHHMFVFICPGDASSTDGDRVGQGYYECGGNESGCNRIGSWAVGPHESCQPPSVGIELDFSEAATIVVKIEAHYDNTSGQPQQDQSGIRIHMTPTLRPLSGVSMITGMAVVNRDFVIPAQEPAYTLSSVCPTVITENLEHPVYAYAFAPHMHLYGQSLVTEHYRCGQKIGELGRISDYEFDNQQSYTLNPPVKILPGDAFVTTCSYDTTTVDFEIKGGEETTDEMCLNFLSLYPRPGTEKYPDLLAGCFSFENGLVLDDGRAVDARIAIGGDQGLVATDFESDPALSSSVGACCAANNCEELYLAQDGVACGVSGDCLEGLVCNGGLCGKEMQSVDVGGACIATSDCIDDLICVSGDCQFPVEEELAPLDETFDASRSERVSSFVGKSFMLVSLALIVLF